MLKATYGSIHTFIIANGYILMEKKGIQSINNHLWIMHNTR